MTVEARLKRPECMNVQEILDTLSLSDIVGEIAVIILLPLFVTSLKQTRIKIEDFFNIAKNTLGLNRIHQYSLPSVEKKVVPIVFLTIILISLSDSLDIDKRAIPYW